MEEYNNEQYLASRIIEQSRHLFVYGYNNECRNKFIKKIDDNYPVVPDSDNSFSLCFKSIDFPNFEVNLNGKSKYTFSVLCNECFSFIVASKLLKKIIESNITNLNERFSNLLQNNYLEEEITSVEELYEEINKSKEFFCENLIKYSTEDNVEVDITKIRIKFLELVSFVKHIKEALGINSYISLVFDNDNDISVAFQYMIMNLMASRINGDISVKVVTEPDAWDTFITSNGVFVEYIHDYGIIELDKDIKKLIRWLKL